MNKQPNICKELIDVGWRFDWDASKKQVRASFGRVVSLGFLSFSEVALDNMDVNEIGQAIADLLNGKGEAQW